MQRLMNLFRTFTCAAVLMTVALSFTNCSTSQKLKVESDYSYHGKFKKYKSFDFVKDMNPNRLEDDPQSRIIEDEIRFRMGLIGYKQTDKKPDLLVSYRIFFDDLRFTGFNQPDIEEWVRYEDEKEKYDPIKYNLRQGTLLILFFDGKQQRTVWQGYASGIFGNALFASEKMLKRPVRAIFDRYRFLAEGFPYDERARNNSDRENNE
ncbi:DUF4136 domain-containing protein [Rhodoflexus caldus]|uniref:DUF4136 domain-containing protein n=1 Tax=Rhodoflexus caldus TaxID=2891236 RepID=UPI00202A2D11|nr:DUF4136 domain-containing protein [Rhodoflexus caldus]